MLIECIIRRQRAELEEDARRATTYADWQRAIGGVVALDVVLQDDLPHAISRCPLPAGVK
jgi:hypothetical protein